MELPKKIFSRTVTEFAVIVLSVLVALGFESWREDVEEHALELEYLVGSEECWSFACHHMHAGCERLLLAESGLLIQRFAENLIAAILPKAVAKLELRKMAARDPKRTFELSAKRRVIHEQNSRSSKTVF